MHERAKNKTLLAKISCQLLVARSLIKKEKLVKYRKEALLKYSTVVLRSMSAISSFLIHQSS